MQITLAFTFKISKYGVAASESLDTKAIMLKHAEFTLKFILQ